jgi:hypothetical protein
LLLFELCKTVEEKARRNDIKEIDAEISKVEEEYERARAALVAEV